MSGFLMRAVALTLLVAALDGYDTLSMSFAAPAITRDWQVGKAALGGVLSSGLVGMALGSLVLAPLADLLGRRRLVLLGIALMGLGSLLSASAADPPQLAGWRIVTGLGLGLCVAVINPLAAEFSNARRRPLAMSIMAVGFPIGGLLGGLLASVLLAHGGWRSIFLAGFAASVLTFAAVVAFLPESLAFLLGSSHPEGLSRLNRLLARAGHMTLEVMPLSPPLRRGYAGVFAPAQAAATARLGATSLLFSGTSYFVLTWLPQMVSDAGFGPSRASAVAAIMNLVGVVACLVVGGTARIGGLVRITMAVQIGCALAVAAFGLAPASLVLLTVAAATCGFFLYASATAFYATLPNKFSDEARASGTGFVIGLGRISSAVAPSLAGWMFASGFGRAEVSAAFACCAVLGALMMAGHRPAALLKLMPT